MPQGHFLRLVSFPWSGCPPEIFVATHRLSTVGLSVGRGTRVGEGDFRHSGGPGDKEDVCPMAHGVPSAPGAGLSTEQALDQYLLDTGTQQSLGFHLREKILERAQ